MNGEAIRLKRVGARISGRVLCQAVGLSRSKLSGIEAGYVAVTPNELVRIAGELDRLIQAKQQLSQIAITLGWPADVEVNVR